VETTSKQTGTPKESINGMKDNAVLNVGSVGLKFLHTPGHSPGSMCILVEESDQSLLLSGDTVFPGSCGRIDL